MKLSARTDYVEAILFKGFVLLNGNTMHGVVEADEEKGYVDYYAPKDNSGLRPVVHNRFLLHRVWGKVEIVPKAA